MTRIEKTLAALNRPALITFITGGDPNYDTSLNVLKSLPAAGADIIELGMPFTDPGADGPTIDFASQRALASGANMHKTLDMVREFRTENTETPIILMGYLNPVHAFGINTFCTAAAEAGVDGLIIVDCPPEESEELESAATAANLNLIRLITPTTDEARLEKLLKGASGFLYYVSIAGVTGSKKANLSEITPHITSIKEQSKMPVAIGFGIKTPQDAANFGRIGDAVVVGSAIVQTIADNANASDLTQKVTAQVSALAQSLKNL
ncbi:MAG: tryptophan synthase subunit alpha [Alphaproteobacteria bacterium]